MDIFTCLTTSSVIIKGGPSFGVYEERDVLAVGFKEAHENSFPLEEVTLIDGPEGVNFLWSAHASLGHLHHEGFIEA